MQTLSQLFEAKLRDVIASQIVSLSNDIAAGGAADHSDYRWLAGRIAGLRMALDRCDEIHADLEKTM